MKPDLNRVASEYFPNAATEFENRLILNWYPHRILSRLGRVSSILELGLGHGVTAPIFDAACDRLVIVEGASKVIDLFRARTPEFRGEIVPSYFEDFVPNERFDAIVMGFVLEHVDSPEDVLRLYRSYLKPGGRLYVAVPNAKSLNRRLGLELGMIKDIYELNANDRAQGHQRQYCRATLTRAVTEAGYWVSYEEGIYLKPLPLSVLRGLPNSDQNFQAMLRVGIEFPDLCVGLLMELQIPDDTKP